MKKWILPALFFVANVVLLIGNYKVYQSNEKMHASNEALYEQAQKTEYAFEHRYDKYVTELVEPGDFAEDELKAEQLEKNKFYEKREEMYESMVSYPTDVVFVGDSQTDRCLWEEFYPQLTVKRRAIPGDTIDGVLSRMDSILATKPSTAFLLIGTNDLYAAAHTKKGEPETMDEMMEDYAAILDIFATESPDTKVYVESVLPMREGDYNRKDYNESIVEFNDRLSKLCEEKHVAYIDFWTPMVGEDGTLLEEYSLDGLHITAAAYQIMKDTIDPLILK